MRLLISLLLIASLSACNKQPASSANYEGPEFEIETCEADDHPNEPECRGTKRHKEWLAKQKYKQNTYKPVYKYSYKKSYSKSKSYRSSKRK